MAAEVLWISLPYFRKLGPLFICLNVHLSYIGIFGIVLSCFVFQEAQRALKAANKSAGGAINAASKGADGKSVRFAEGKQQAKSEGPPPLAGASDIKKAAASKGQPCVSTAHAAVKKPAQQTSAAVGNLSNLCS
jgi:hypothetical protein